MSGLTITLNVTVGKAYWSDDSVQNQVELKTDCPYPGKLPWDDICSDMVRLAIEEYEQKQEKEGAEK